MYQGAATFEQSLTYLQTNAFDLFHMEPFGEDEAEKMTFGMHGRGKTLGLEVDFRRSVRDVVKHAEADRQATILKLYKLAFMAFMKGGLALGLQALKQRGCAGRDVLHRCRRRGAGLLSSVLGRNLGSFAQYGQAFTDTAKFEPVCV